MKTLYEKIAKMREFSLKVVKSKDNPYFKSKFADLNSVIEVTDPILEAVGLIYIDKIDGMNLISEILDPETEKSIRSTTPLLMTKQDSQSFSSALTYARRFNRVAMMGLQQLDSDGDIASGTTFVKPAQIKRIQALLLETNTKAEMFLGHYHVQAIKDMTQATADGAEKTLQLKKEKGLKDGK